MCCWNRGKWIGGYSLARLMSTCVFPFKLREGELLRIDVVVVLSFLSTRISYPETAVRILFHHRNIIDHRRRLLRSLSSRFTVKTLST